MQQGKKKTTSRYGDKPGNLVQRIKASDKITEAPLGAVELPVSCRCAKYPHTHLHSPEDARAAIRRWNREAKNKVALLDE